MWLQNAGFIWVPFIVVSALFAWIGMNDLADARASFADQAVFKAHMVLGMTIFLVFPFTRLVHVWSGFATLAYVLRPYQMVRSRRLNLPAGQLEPQRRLTPAASSQRVSAPRHEPLTRPVPVPRPVHRDV